VEPRKKNSPYPYLAKIVYAKYATTPIARIATIATMTIGAILLPEPASGVNPGVAGAESGAAAVGVDTEVGATAGAAGMENEPRSGIGVGADVCVLYPSMESPETATSRNAGAPPPLSIIDSISDRIVRIFTSGGGGGGVFAKTLFRGFSISTSF